MVTAVLTGWPYNGVVLGLLCGLRCIAMLVECKRDLKTAQLLQV